MSRPVCTKCNVKPRALNYVRKGVKHYRSKCLHCIEQAKQEKSLEHQALVKSGYKKRNECDRCHFVAKHPSQLTITYLDGNRLNVSRQNLRTYCANCIAEIAALPSKNKGGLVPDY